MQLVNKRNLIIAGSVVVLVLIIAGLFALQQARNNASKTQTTAGQDTQTVDKNSGETVSNIADKTPETFGLLPNTPIYLNIAEFTTNGLSDTQLADLKYAFYQYTTAQNPKIKQVSITKDSVQAAPPASDGKVTATFGVAFDDGSKINGTLVYFGDSVELTLAKASGQKIFESGTITNKSIEIQ